MPQYFGYLRVSTLSQDVESQEIGLIKYANKLGFAPLHITAETIGRDKDWRKRKLKEILDACSAGDVIVTPEFTRLADQPAHVFSFLEEAAAKGVTVHISKTGTVMDGSIQSKIVAAAFSMASMIELEFIRVRTKEGIALARANGKQIGRPKGSTGFSKLAGKDNEIDQLLKMGLSKRKTAKYLNVSYSCLDNFLKNQSKRDFKNLDKVGLLN